MPMDMQEPVEMYRCSMRRMRFLQNGNRRWEKDWYCSTSILSSLCP